MKITDYFEYRDEKYFLKEDSSEWIVDAVRAAHFGDLPSDWVYRKCYEFCCLLDSEEIKEPDDIWQWADSAVDIYNSNLIDWLQNHYAGNLFAEAEDQAADIDSNQRKHICEQIMLIQCCALIMIGEMMFQHYTKHLEESDNADEE